MFLAAALIFFGLTLPSGGGPSPAWLPAAPWTLGAFVATAAALLSLGVGSQRESPAARVLGIVATAVPFLLFARLATPLGPHMPALPFVAILGAVAALFVASLPPSVRVGAASALLAWGLLAHALGPIGIPLLPERWLVSAPSDRPLPTDRTWCIDACRGPVKGRAARSRTPLGEGEGPWWVRAEDGAEGRPRPIVAGFVAEAPAAAQTSRWTWIDGSYLDVLAPLDLEPFDVVWIGPGAWPDGSRDTPTRLAAIAEFVRGGGTAVVVKGAEETLPDGVDVLLTAVDRPIGLGRIVSYDDPVAAVAALLDGHLWVASVDTVFDGDPTPPPRPAALEPWTDDPSRRGPALGVLALFVIAVATFGWANRDVCRAALAVALASAAASVALVWVTPTVSGHRTHAMRIDLGALGGRRVEAIAILAGPTGFRGAVSWRGGGYARFLGGVEHHAEGEVEIVAGGTAWAVRSTRADLPEPEDREERTNAWLLALLRGEVRPERARLGGGVLLPVTVAGAAPPPAATLAYAVR